MYSASAALHVPFFTRREETPDVSMTEGNLKGYTILPVFLVLWYVGANTILRSVYYTDMS